MKIFHWKSWRIVIKKQPFNFYLALTFFAGIFVFWENPAYSASRCSRYYLDVQTIAQGLIPLKRTEVSKELLRKNTLRASSKTRVFEDNNKRLIEVLEAPSRTKVVILSLSLTKEILRGIKGVRYYDTRGFLGEVLEAKDGKTNVLIISAVSLSHPFKKYILSFLPENRRSAISFMSASEFGETVSVERSLSQTILDNPKFMAAIKSKIKNIPSYLSFFVTTSLEEKISHELGIPFWMIHPDLNFKATKSWNRRHFKRVGRSWGRNAMKSRFFEYVNIIPGFEGIESVESLIIHADKLWLQNPEGGKFVPKHDDGVSGQGNGIYILPRMSESLRTDFSARIKIIVEALQNIELVESTSSPTRFLEEFGRRGGIVEKFIDGLFKTSPSAQGMIYPNGRVEIISTHEQILDGQTYKGAIFPANESYRGILQEHAWRVGQELFENNKIIGPFAVDYVAVSRSSDLNVDVIIYPVEINIRRGGTSYPYLIAKLATDSVYDPFDGELKAPDGNRIYYIATDNFKSKAFKGRTEEELFETISNMKILFKPGQQVGVSPYLLIAAYEYEKFGLIFIANDLETAQKLFDEMESWRLSLENEENVE